MSKSYHLVQNTAETPNIGFLVVRLLLTDFWGEVVRSTDRCLCAVVGVLQYSGNAEISDFYLVLRVKKYVLGLQVAVQDFSVVHVLDRKADLHEPVED